jgi:hypothetical protein
MSSDEASTLLNRPAAASKSSWPKALGAGTLLVLAGFVVLHQTRFRAQAPSAELIAATESYSSSSSSLSSSSRLTNVVKDWQLYKHTIALGMNSGHTWAHMHKQIGIFSEDTFTMTELGCGGLRFSGDLGQAASSPLQLHAVGSRILDYSKPSSEDWEKHFTELFGDMTTWHIMMDNKVSLYVPDIQKYINKLDALKYDYMVRLTTVGGDDFQYAHVLVPVTGVIYELVGPTDTLDDPESYSTWLDDECPELQKPKHTISTNDKVYKHYNNTQPMPISMNVPTSSLELSKLLREHLQVFTDAHVDHIGSDTDGCNAFSIDWAELDYMRVLLVSNSNHEDQTATLTRFEGFVTELNRGMDVDGSGWTHFLDYHIGIESFESEVPDGCHENLREYTESLRHHDIKFGGRHGDIGTNSSHLYVGYPGYLCFEFNVPCVNQVFSNLCACDPSNNLDTYTAETGGKCPRLSSG